MSGVITPPTYQVRCVPCPMPKASFKTSSFKMTQAWSLNTAKQTKQKMSTEQHSALKTKSSNFSFKPNKNVYIRALVFTVAATLAKKTKHPRVSELVVWPRLPAACKSWLSFRVTLLKPHVKVDGISRFECMLFFFKMLANSDSKMHNFSANIVWTIYIPA